MVKDYELHDGMSVGKLEKELTYKCVGGGCVLNRSSSSNPKSAGPCLEGELVERNPHLTVHSFVRWQRMYFGGEVLMLLKTIETAEVNVGARHWHIREVDRRVDRVRRPRRADLRRQ